MKSVFGQRTLLRCEEFDDDVFTAVEAKAAELRAQKILILFSLEKSIIRPRGNAVCEFLCTHLLFDIFTPDLQSMPMWCLGGRSQALWESQWSGIENLQALLLVYFLLLLKGGFLFWVVVANFEFFKFWNSLYFRFAQALASKPSKRLSALSNGKFVVMKPCDSIFFIKNS